VKFAVADFGTENSNISLLQRFPFDYIKIDKQFIDRVAGCNRQLIEGISFLANKLGESVVAEGVEEGTARSVEGNRRRFREGLLLSATAWHRCI